MISGRFNVDCLIHDRSGAERLKVIALRSGTPLETGEAVFITGTASTSFKSIPFNTYRNAAGDLVTLSEQTLLAFSWSGSSRRVLYDTGGSEWRVGSSNGSVAVTTLGSGESLLGLAAGSGTGTYSIILWGAT